MAKTDNIRGTAKVEFGTPGDGVVGASLTEFSGKVVLPTATFDGGDITETTIKTEGDDKYLTVNTDTSPTIFNVKLLEVKGDDAVMFMGGSWDDTEKEWSAPVGTPNIYLSCVITDLNGNVITIPYAKIKAKFAGNITKGELLALDVTVTVNTPVSALGVEGAPFVIKYAA